MSSSSSSPQNTTSTTTNASEQNLAATNTQGVTLIGNKGTTSLSTTSNTVNNTVNQNLDASVVNAAINGNASVAKAAISAGNEFATAGLAANTGLSETLFSNATDFGSHALDVVSRSQTQSASLISDVLSQGLSFEQSQTANVVDLARENQAANNAQLGNIATTLANITAANDTTQASQSTAFATGAFKIAAAVIVIVSVAYFATRRG